MKKNNALIAFILSTLLGAIITLPNIILGKGIFSLIADLNLQQIPFLMTINRSIKSGAVLWTWFNEFGSNFIPTFSFYNLFSPFNIITYFFSANIVRYLIGPIFILKYAVAGLTSYLFLKRYVKNEKWAIVGSLLYAFSGFQLTNTLFYHFHDIVALFPLVLYTLDNLVYDNKKGRFALTIALCAFTNWFFFIGICVFTLIYYFVKLFTKEYKFTIKSFRNVVIEAILGTLLASLVLVPSALFTMGNPRVTSSWGDESPFMFRLYRMTEILKALIMPSENMTYRSIFNPTNYYSLEAYLPLVGLVFVIPYVIKNFKKWDSILFIISIIMMFVPILNSIYFAFQPTYYARWFYLPVLIMSLITIKSLDEGIKIKSGVIGTYIGYLIWLIAIILFKIKNKDSQLIFQETYFILMISFAIINPIITFLISRIKSDYRKYIAYVIGIFVFVGLWGNYTIYTYKQGDMDTHEWYINYLDSEKYLKDYKEYRTNSDVSCLYNFGYTADLNNIKSWNSNINSSNFTFLYSNGYIKRTIMTEIPTWDYELNDFLGVKYIISCENNEFVGEDYKFVEKNGPYRIFENKNPNTIGFAPKKYISEDDYLSLDYYDRKNKIIDTVVLNNEQIEEYAKLFKKKVAFKESNFEFKNNGFDSHIDSTGETLAVFQVPYDEGWIISVNGENRKVENVDEGMIGIKIDEGINEIHAKYYPKGLKLGIILSISAIVGYLLYCIFIIRKDL